MTIASTMPSRDYLLARLEYHAGGYLIWKRRPATDFARPCAEVSINGKCAGNRAGATRSDGRRQICVNGQIYGEHRLIYHMYVAELTADQHQIDHKNGDNRDNRIANLRFCTASQNMMNVPPPPRKDGLPRNVRWSKRERKYKVRIYAHGVSHHIGTFVNLGEAVCAATEARQRLHGEFARAA